jgi:hypothetical protein
MNNPIREQTGAAKEKVLHRLEMKKERAASSVADIGEAIRDAEVSLQEKNHARAAEYVGRVADRIEALAHQVETSHPRDLYRSANAFAQRRPKLTVAALFLGGFALGRFLRASEHHDGEWRDDRRAHRDGRTEDPTGRWLDDGGEPLPADSGRKREEPSFAQPPMSGNTEDGTFRSSVD